MSSGRDLWQMCRRSSGFESERSPQFPDGTGGVDGEKCVRECVSVCSPLHVCDFLCLANKLSLLSHRTNLTDGIREGEKEGRGTGRRGAQDVHDVEGEEEGKACSISRSPHLHNSSITGWNKFPSPQNTTGINGGSAFMALSGYRMQIKHASASFVPRFNLLADVQSTNLLF